VCFQKDSLCHTLWFEHAQKNACLRKVFVVVHWIIMRAPSNEAVKTRENGSHQLVRITCGDLSERH
jgi:hypothetical protein